MSTARSNKTIVNKGLITDAKSFYKIAVEEDVCKPINNDLYIELFYKLCFILVIEEKLFTNVYDNTLLKDHTLIRDYKVSAFPNVFHNPTYSSFKAKVRLLSGVVHNESFMNYLKCLTVSDVTKLSNYVSWKIFSSQKYAVEFSQMLLNEELFRTWNHEEKITGYKDFTFNSLIVGEDYNETKRNENFITVALNNINMFMITRFYIDYMKETGSKFNIEKGKILTQHQESWIKTPEYTNYIMFKLLQKYSTIEVMSCIDFVLESDYSFTVDEWMNLIDNYEEYKDMPVSWVAELVKDDNS